MEQIKQHLIENYDEDDALETAWHEAAHAVAYEVLMFGVREVTVEATAEYRGETRPNSPDPLLHEGDALVCILASPAIDASRGDEDMRLQVDAVLDGDMDEVSQSDLARARHRADESGEVSLRDAWDRARAFVKRWEEVIEHLAYRLVSDWRMGDLPLDGFIVREFVREREMYGLTVE